MTCSITEDRVTIVSIPDTRKANKEKQFPVKIRVTFRGDRKYCSTRKNMTESEWERLPFTKSKSANEIKERIQVLSTQSENGVGKLSRPDFTLQLLVAIPDKFYSIFLICIFIFWFPSLGP